MHPSTHLLSEGRMNNPATNLFIIPRRVRILSTTKAVTNIHYTHMQNCKIVYCISINLFINEWILYIYKFLHFKINVSHGIENDFYVKHFKFIEQFNEVIV